MKKIKKIVISVSFVIMCTLMAAQVYADPVPDIKANSSDSSIMVQRGAALNITVALDPGDFAGESLDWWVEAQSPLGNYWYVKGQGWRKSTSPLRAYGGALISLDPRSILNDSSLPDGIYTFIFSIDNNNDNCYDQTFNDSVQVSIAEQTFVRECRDCHEHPESYPVLPILIRDRHHSNAATKHGLMCLDCHQAVWDETTQSYNLQLPDDCRECHGQPDIYPVLDIPIRDRHHQKASSEGIYCTECHH